MWLQICESKKESITPKVFLGVFLEAYQGSRFTLRITSKFPFTDATSKSVLHLAYKLNTIRF